MIRFFLILAYCLLVSCGSGDTVDESVIETSDPVVEEVEEVPFSVTIDERDLVILPEDTGGEHLAVEFKDTEAPFGYYIYEPEFYREVEHDYPLLLFLHGWHPNLGDEPLRNVLVDGPPKLIQRKQWNPKFPLLVVSPQLRHSYWYSHEIHAFIKYLIKTYRVNPERIYLTGLSLGGGGCWYYVGEYEENYAAAIVPISASGNPGLIDNLTKVPIWAFHGGKDTTVKAYEDFGSVPMVLTINDNNPEIRARVTVYDNVGHNAWSMTYDGTGTGYRDQSYDTFDMDIYDWMLAYKKSDQKE